MRLRVYHKIILPFLVVVVMGILSTLPYGIGITSRLNQERADRELETVSVVSSNYIEVRLDELLAFTLTALQDQTVRKAISSGDKSTLVKLLLPMKVRLRVDLVAAYGPEGDRLLSLGDPRLLEQAEALRALPMARMGINIKSLEFTPGGPIMVAAVPNETILRGMDGVLLFCLSLDEKFLAGLEKLVGHPVALLSLEGGQPYASRPALAESLLRPRPLASGVPSYTDLFLDEEPYRAYVGPLTVYNVPKASIVVAGSQGEIIEFRDRMIRFMLIMSLLATLTVVVMGLVLARHISNPISRLLTLTGEVGRGNLEVSVERFSGDELGDLALGFNRMVAGLKSNMDEIQSSRAKIARYAHELEKFSFQLQMDKKEIEAILKNMRDGLVLLDRQGNIIALNPEAERIVSCSREACLGKEVTNALVPFLSRLADPDSLLMALDSERLETRAEETLEVTLQAPVKTVYRLKIYPVFDEEKKLLGRLIIWNNITREKEVEEMKNNFLATISHELRTPLTSIKGALNLLLDGNLGLISQDQREFIKIAGHNCDRLTSLVNNLLDLARMEAGELRPKKSSCDLAVLIKKSIQDLKALLVAQEVQIGFYPSARIAPIQADPERMVQLVTNLLDNAIKFSPKGGRIAVGLEELVLDPAHEIPERLAELSSGLYFLVQVADSGRGIPPDQLERIFDKFHQADMSSTRTAGGSGLGLAIARTIVRDHGGIIWAENRSEGGSRISFVLPKAPVDRKVRPAQT